MRAVESFMVMALSVVQARAVNGTARVLPHSDWRSQQVARRPAARRATALDKGQALHRAVPCCDSCV